MSQIVDYSKYMTCRQYHDDCLKILLGNFF